LQAAALVAALDLAPGLHFFSHACPHSDAAQVPIARVVYLTARDLSEGRRRNSGTEVNMGILGIESQAEADLIQRELNVTGTVRLGQRKGPALVCRRHGLRC
jgi:hypothetical protein